MTMLKLPLVVIAAAAAAPVASASLDACLFQPLYRQVSFEDRDAGSPLNGLSTNQFGWGGVSFSTTGEFIFPPEFYRADATVVPADSSVQLLVTGKHVVGPVLPDFQITVTFPRPVTQASFYFGAPILARDNLVAWIMPLDANGNGLGLFQAITNQSAGSYPGGEGPIPVTREGIATVSGLEFSGLLVWFEPEGGFFPGYEDPASGAPRDFRFDELRWTPVPYCCAGDYNGDGEASVPDIFDFLAAWFRNDRNADPRTDFNVSGVVDVQDLFAFLAAWFASCN